MPRTTLLGTMRASHVSAPDDASISIVRPIAIPAPYRISGAVCWAITMAAIALRGWTGIGIRYARPVRICMAPNMMSTLAPSRWDARATPIMSGTSVPMSPNAPDSSLRSKRMAARRYQAGKPPQVRLDRARGLAFHGALAAQDFGAQLRDAGAAAAASAGQRFDQRPAEGGVDRLDKQPGAAVGHAHFARRGGDRTGACDGREQIGPPRPDRYDCTDQNADFRNERP